MVFNTTGMKLSNWYKQRPNQIMIRAGICLLLLAGLVLFRREALSKQDLKWIIFAALVILFVLVFKFFAGRSSRTSEKDGTEEKQ